MGRWVVASWVEQKNHRGHRSTTANTEIFSLRLWARRCLAPTLRLCVNLGILCIFWRPWRLCVSLRLCFLCEFVLSWRPLCPWRPWRYHPQIGTDLHRLKKNHRGRRKLQRTQKLFSWRPSCPWQPWRYHPPIDTDLHRLKEKTTEDTEIYREHRKIFSLRPLRFSAPLLSLRLCVTFLASFEPLASLASLLCALCASVSSASLRYHPQIYTDLHRLKG